MFSVCDPYANGPLPVELWSPKIKEKALQCASPLPFVSLRLKEKGHLRMETNVLSVQYYFVNCMEFEVIIDFHSRKPEDALKHCCCD